MACILCALLVVKPLGELYKAATAASRLSLSRLDSDKTQLIYACDVRLCRISSYRASLTGLARLKCFHSCAVQQQAGLYSQPCCALAGGVVVVSKYRGVGVLKL